MVEPTPNRRITRRRALGLGTGALVLAAIGGVGVFTMEPTDPLAHYNAALPYRLVDVRSGAPVPRVFVRYLDPPLNAIADTDTRKDVFLRILLPLVLAANEKRVAERRIPVAMALAQGAIESGWGTARFAVEANAIFGQRTWAEGTPGLKPQEGAGDFRVQAFSSLMASVESYIENLNTHPRYEVFREARTAHLKAGQPPVAEALLPHISAYSEEGRAYVAKVRAIIAENRLGDFATARLK